MKKFLYSFIIIIASISSYSQTPFTEGFEGGVIPSTWTIINVSGPNFQWGINDPLNTNRPAHQGQYAAYMERENVLTGGAEDWLVTPLIDLSMYQDPELIFYSRLTIAADNGTFYRILISTDSPNNTSDFISIKDWTEPEINPVSEQYREVRLNLLDLISNSGITGVDENSSIYIAFVMVGDFGDRWLIDDVKIRSNCQDPQSLTASNITDTSAELSWASTGASSWEVELIEASIAPTGSGIMVNQNNYLATTTSLNTPLLEGHNYKYYIRALCGSGSTENKSEWIGPYQFRILNRGETCDVPIVVPSTLPYIDTHENFVGSGYYSGSPGYGCGTNYMLNGFYTVYSYTASATTSINISATPIKNATGIFIYDSCSNIGVNCLASQSDMDPLSKSINNFQVTSGNTYYIVVATSEEGNHYTFSISESSCTSTIEANFNIDSQCLPLSGFDAVVNIQNLGGATSLVATAFTGGIASTPQIISAPGTISFAGFSSSENAVIVLSSEQNSNCFVISPPLSKNLCPPVNDECVNAVLLTPDISGSGSYTHGTLSGATASLEASSCSGSEDDDVWYKFIAINTKHIINISNVNGIDTNISFAIYEGTDCNTFNQINCGTGNNATLTNLITGQTYYIRVFTSGSSSTQTTFDIATTAFPPNCTDSNPQSNVVKDLFINLLNHLIDVHEYITVSEAELPGSQGYYCPELAALAPYIIDDNPSIHHFQLNESGLSFSFQDHGEGIANADVYIPLNNLVHIAEINFFSYTSPEYTSDAHFTFVDGGTYSKRINISHINFCPDSPCIPVEGNINLSSGLECMVIGNTYGIIFTTNVPNVNIENWVIFELGTDNLLGEIVETSHQQSPTISFETTGSYLIKVTVTTPGGCSTVIQKVVQVQDACNQCTESDNQSLVVKDLFIDLANYLLSNYTALMGQGPFNCPELAALAPYISDANPLIYNLTYYNGLLSFSFSNHTESDVVLQNNGAINDISVLGFTTASVEFNLLTNYLNGTIGNNFIKHINFCPGNPCPPLEGNIVFDTGLSCVTMGEPSTFSFHTTANITGYSWTFFDQDGVTPLNQSPITSQQHTITYNIQGNYLVQVVLIYGNNCTATFTKSITVASECFNCTENNSSTAYVKQSYIDLINHLLFTVTNNGVIPNPYTCPEMEALAPFISDNHAKVWNVNYNNNTDVLTFSFSDHGTSFDVSVPANGIVTDINLMNFSDALNTSSFTTYYSNGSASSEHVIRHVDFCPAECTPLQGFIEVTPGQSCIPLYTEVEFSLQAVTSNIISYSWTFTDTNGVISSENLTNEVQSKTFHTPGNYLVTLVIKDVYGCMSTFYKNITVGLSCDACTENNILSGNVTFYFKSLLNKLINTYEQGLTINDADLSFELAILSPYLTDPEPGIYNVDYTNNILSFSFSQSELQPDVVLYGLDNVMDINLLNYTSPSISSNNIVTYSNGTQSTLTINHVNFCPDLPVPEPCESHVAFVIDESGSIDDYAEANNIKAQLANFVHQQMGSNLTVSFIGMSDSDNNSRNDHITGKITASNKGDFLTWIEKFKSGYVPARPGISANSDYWASGLSYAYNLPLKPTLIIVITDGSQTEDVNGLKNIISQIDIDPDSHLFVYGIDNGFYVDENHLTNDANNPLAPESNETVVNLMTSLKYLMNLPITDFPVNGQENLLNVDYYDGDNEFDFLYTEDIYFSQQLYLAGLGCGGNPLKICSDCETFQPAPGGTYWISGWIKEERNIQVKTYTNGFITLIFKNGSEQEISRLTFLPEGDIIDGWQQVGSKFTIPNQTNYIRIELENSSENIPIHFDDIRIHPINGSMKSFVYDPETFRLMAEHDENNFSTFYEYDKEGGLIRVKKETAKGIKTIQESRSGNVIKTQN